MLSVAVLVTTNAWGQQATNYSIVANIIYRFTKYVDWPERRKSGDFVIGIVGETPLYNALTVLVKEKFVGKQPIVVRKIGSDADMYNCHLLFISQLESSQVKGISKMTAGKPILIVSENNGLAKRGSCINIIVVGERLKLEFSLVNIEKRDLDIASELLSLGTIVN